MIDQGEVGTVLLVKKRSTGFSLFSHLAESPRGLSTGTRVLAFAVCLTVGLVDVTL